MWEDLIQGMPSGGDLSGLEMPTGQDWMSNFDFSGGFPSWQMPEPSGGWDPQTGWPGSIFTAGGPVGLEGKAGTDDSSWWSNLANLSPGTKGLLGAAGWLGKEGFGAYQAIDRANQMRDYNDQYAKWVAAQNDYIKQKQAWESDFMNQFKGAQEEFAGANEEFQGQLGAATEQANMVLGEFMKAAKPLLAQSQELLVPAVAALARGEVPEQWQPLLNDAKQKATAAAVQSMVSAGMSPDEARASVQPVVDQQAHQMLLALASSMSQQGLATGQQGMAGLQGAGQLTGILGQLAQAGMGPATQEFAAMASVLGHILGGGTTMVPPGKPSA